MMPSDLFHHLTDTAASTAVSMVVPHGAKEPGITCQMIPGGLWTVRHGPSPRVIWGMSVHDAGGQIRDRSQGARCVCGAGARRRHNGFGSYCFLAVAVIGPAAMRSPRAVSAGRQREPA